MSPRASVVVLSWRAGPFLTRCLEALLHQDFQDFELILVDQGEQNGVTRAAESHFAPHFGGRLRVLWAGRNLGFAGGNNLALAYTRGEWVALLNADATPEPGWLQALVQAGEEDPHIGMCASRLILKDNLGSLDNTGHLLYADGLNVPRGRGQKPDQWEEGGEVLCPSGAAGLYRRRAVEEVGGFDPAFFAYGEDLDLGLCLRARGWRAVYVPGAVATHHLSGSLGRTHPLKVFLVERNRVRVAVRHFPGWVLLDLPLFTALRYGGTVWSALHGRGPLAAVKPGWMSMITVALATGLGHGVALLELPWTLASRRRLHLAGIHSSALYGTWLNQFGASLEEVSQMSL